MIGTYFLLYHVQTILKACCIADEHQDSILSLGSNFLENFDEKLMIFLWRESCYSSYHKLTFYS